MDVRYCFAFVALAGSGIIATVVGWDILGWPSLAFSYAAFSFFLLAVAYGGVGARLLLKQSTGRQSVWAWVLFAPYFLLNTLSFRLYCLVSREPAYAAATSRLFFGRKLTSREVRGAETHGWVAVLDLAAEFGEVSPLRQLPTYRSLPVLDATSPTGEELRFATEWLAEAIQSGPVYIHCALGHGRTACVVIAYLLSVGVVPNVNEGVRLLRSYRPGVRLHPVQRRMLQAYEPTGEQG